MFLEKKVVYFKKVLAFEKESCYNDARVCSADFFGGTDKILLPCMEATKAHTEPKMRKNRK